MVPFFSYAPKSYILAPVANKKSGFGDSDPRDFQIQQTKGFLTDLRDIGRVFAQSILYIQTSGLSRI